MKISARLSAAELAALVQHALAPIDSNTVLVGGSVVDLYTRGRYVSADIDLVSYRSRREVQRVMESLGFVDEGMHWSHPRTPYLIQIVNPPPMVGHKYVSAPRHVRTRAGRLAVLSPLDCVLDRFAWYLFNGDRQCLEQAALVAAAKKIDFDDVAEWLAREEAPAADKRRALAELKRLTRA